MELNTHLKLDNELNGTIIELRASLKISQFL
jgi:hypothetical protein